MVKLHTRSPAAMRRRIVRVETLRRSLRDQVYRSARVIPPAKSAVPSDGTGYAKSQLRAILWALAQRGASPAILLTVVVLWLFADEFGAAQPTHRRIASIVNLGVRSVQDACAALRMFGFLASTPVKDPNSHKRLRTLHVLALPTSERDLVAPLEQLPPEPARPRNTRQLPLPFPGLDIDAGAPAEPAESHQHFPAGEAPDPNGSSSGTDTTRASAPPAADPIDHTPTRGVSASRDECDDVARYQRQLERNREALKQRRREPAMADAFLGSTLDTDVVQDRLRAAQTRAAERGFKLQLASGMTDRTEPRKHRQDCECRLCEARERRH